MQKEGIRPGSQNHLPPNQKTICFILCTQSVAVRAVIVRIVRIVTYRHMTVMMVVKHVLMPSMVTMPSIITAPTAVIVMSLHYGRKSSDPQNCKGYKDSFHIHLRLPIQTRISR